jgi:hypothetical protein
LEKVRNAYPTGFMNASGALPVSEWLASCRTGKGLAEGLCRYFLFCF